MKQIAAMESRHKEDVKQLQNQINDLKGQLSALNTGCTNDSNAKSSQEDPYIPSMESQIEHAILGGCQLQEATMCEPGCLVTTRT